MADENKGGTPESGAESITQIKGEFNRKIGNLEQQVSQMTESNKALVAQIQSMSRTPASAAAQAQGGDDEDAQIEKEWFDNPAKAASLLSKKVSKQVREEVTSGINEQAGRTNTINELIGEFPELRKADHSLTKRAVEIYNSLSDRDKSSPLAYRHAVSQAALEQGVKPNSKREPENDPDDFTLDGAGASNVRQSSRRRGKGDIDPLTAEFARMVGVDMDDEKVKERIKNNHGRRTYTRYE